MAVLLSNSKANISALTEGTADTVHTHSGNDTKVTGIWITNTSASTTVLANIFIANGANKFYIVKNLSIPAGQAWEITDSGEIMLAASDIIKAFADSANIDVIVSYAELY